MRSTSLSLMVSTFRQEESVIKRDNINVMPEKPQQHDRSCLMKAIADEL